MADVGKVLSPLLSAQSGQVQKSADVLLAKYDSNEVSEVFVVTDKPLRLLAFGLHDADKVRVLRVYLPMGKVNRDCCGKLEASGEILEKVHTVGGKAVWLDSVVDELVIDAQGAYRLAYEGQNRLDVQVAMLSDAVVRVNDTVRGIGGR